MAKKRRAMSKVRAKAGSVAKRGARRVAVRPVKSVGSGSRRMSIVVKNLILFAILSLVSWLFYTVSNVDMYQTLFLLLTYILGFVALAFLIVLFVLLFLKLIGR